MQLEELHLGELCTGRNYTMKRVMQWKELHLGGITPGRSYTLGGVMQWKELHLGGSQDIPVPHYFSSRPSYRKNYTWKELSTGRSYTLGRTAHCRYYAVRRFTH